MFSKLIYSNYQLAHSCLVIVEALENLDVHLHSHHDRAYMYMYNVVLELL